ncbi:restriction endonuclease [Helicobacter sp. MIT 00-7814]|uniref:restriction endonuclease n=1 Tax=unclassified Helicobacter TaxID=2593540 RepID=UPI000E1E2BE5|nr:MULTISPECIES: restriction endonuclease [unclassified Helicobacter]RDU51520.1 restriction endonuclease [Helicobacter sp. MIT 00-7814]RDU56988.1 restriction endonuclease [Helicobacter sp. MIT 99-10781]
MELENILLELIEQKYDEIKAKQKNGIFEKILHFEGNAIGQIGEKFIKEVFKRLSLPLDEVGGEVIHDEFDLLSNGKKIEVKTARKGLNNNTFQFNGINPKYNYDFIILLGLTTQSLHYYIIDKKRDYRYDHKARREFISINNKEKQLVQMNPGNVVNLKLTLTLKELKDISKFEAELINYFKE